MGEGFFSRLFGGFGKRGAGEVKPPEFDGPANRSSVRSGEIIQGEKKNTPRVLENNENSVQIEQD